MCLLYNKNNVTALHIASKGQNERIVLKLLELGAQVDAIDVCVY
jgi:ankyrin repeat protein